MILCQRDVIPSVFDKSEEASISLSLRIRDFSYTEKSREDGSDGSIKVKILN